MGLAAILANIRNGLILHHFENAGPMGRSAYGSTIRASHALLAPEWGNARQFVHGQHFSEPQLLQTDRRHPGQKVMERQVRAFFEALGIPVLTHLAHLRRIPVAREHRGDLVPWPLVLRVTAVLRTPVVLRPVDVP
jgi:hypothetical protein